MDTNKIDGLASGDYPSTPYGKLVQDTTRMKRVQYGFYPVATQPVNNLTCARCDGPFPPGSGLFVNSEPVCRKCVIDGKMFSK